METRITLDALTASGVSVKSQAYIVQDGKEYAAGPIHRRSYANSARGRIDITAELPEPYLSAVMAAWGDAPTVIPV